MRSKRRRIPRGAARTPIFGGLRRVLKLACRADRPHAPSADELIEQGRETTQTRREALRVSAALALGAGVVNAEEPAAPRIATRGVPRIAIVGAGIAGLSAAYHLKKAGLRARVYEAGKRVGGRILSVEGVVGPGLVTDFGGEFIDSEHKDMLALIKEFGLGLVDTSADGDGALAREAYFFSGVHHTEAQAVEAFRPIASRIEDDADAVGPPGRFRDDPEAIAIDKLSIAEYLDRLGAQGWLRRLIDVAFAVEYGLDCDRLSAINLLTLIETDLEKEQFALYGESDERYKVRGGSQQVVDALARRLAGQIEFEHCLESVRKAGDALHLDFARPGGQGVGVEADFVIVAIPFSVLRGVELRLELPPRKKAVIEKLGYGTNAKLAAGFRRRVWREQGYTGAVFSDEPFQTGWDHTRLQGAEAGGLTLFPGGRAGVALGEGTAASQVAKLLPGVERVYPGASAAFNGRADRYQWPTAPFALGSYSCYMPGQWTTLAGSEGTPVGNLLFAGEHCRFGDAGFMDSGAASGRRTARALLARLTGRRAP